MKNSKLGWDTAWCEVSFPEKIKLASRQKLCEDTNESFLDLIYFDRIHFDPAEDQKEF